MNTKDLLKERGSIYGDIRDNMNCAHELMRVLDKYMYNRSLSNPYLSLRSYDFVGHQGCLVMICHKLARIVTGATIHADNYDDIGGYARLARDIAVKGEKENAKDDSKPGDIHSKVE